MREGRDLDGSSRRRERGVGCLVCFLTVCLLVGSPYGARAIGVVSCDNPEHDALGIDAPSAVLVFDFPVGHEERMRWNLEAGRRRLFGVEGLVTDAVRLSVCRDGWGISTSAALLSAPVGREGLSRITFLWAPTRRIGVAPSLRVDTASFDGFQQSYVLSTSVRVFARVSSKVVFGSAVEKIRIDGEPCPGADAVCHTVFYPESPLCGLVRLSVSRSGRVGFGVSSRLRLSGVLAAAVGYEDDTGMLKGSMTLNVAQIHVSAGASIHPVLGVSESLFVSWGR